VLGVSINGQHKAYPLKALQKLETALEDQIGDTQVKVVYDSTADSAQVYEAESGKLLPSVIAYWFAWATFHQDPPVYGNPSATLPSRSVLEGWQSLSSCLEKATASPLKHFLKYLA
jgi:hypothetical protein